MNVLIHFLLLFTNIFALYEDSKYVVSLTNDNFDEMVLNNNDRWLVNFYAPWCRHCVRFVEEFEGIARILKSFFRFGAVDVTQYKKLKIRFKVRKFPTLLIFSGNKSKPVTYVGPKDRNSIALSVLSRNFLN